jgi:hypothetical protein
MKNPQRRYELTSKFLKMGNALVEEGKSLNDPVISQLGSFITFIGGLCFDDDDVMKFSDLVGMYSAKKVLDELEKNKQNPLHELLNISKKISYDDIISEVDDMIDGLKNGDFDIDSENPNEEPEI